MAISPRVYKPKVHVVLDTETLGIVAHSAIIEIGAVVCMGGEEQYFECSIKPSSYVGTQFHIDSETVAWHNGRDPEFLAKMEAEGVSFQEAAQRFHGWLMDIGNGKELHVWSQGKDFDFPKLDYLFAAAGCGKPPYTYSRIHCTRDILWLNPGARLKGANPAAHTALADATWAAAQLVAIVNSSNWYQRLFK